MRNVKPWLWGLAIGLFALAPVLREWDHSGWGDWQQFHHWWEAGRVALLRHGEFPLYDPYHCGGVPMWGQPQMQYLAPTWWLTGVAFGTIHGHKLFMLLHHVVGFAGMYIVGRRIVRLNVPAAGLAALAWAFSGYFAWRGAGGHATFFGFHYLPLIFYCWRKTDHDLRYAGGVAGLLGLQLLEGGTYPFPLTFLVVAFDFVMRLPTARWRLVRTAAITGTLTALFGSIRLWPIYQTMSRFPRATRMEDAQTLAEVLTTLTAREPHRWLWGHRWVWGEYGSFVGWTVVVMGAVGAVLAWRRARNWHLPLGLLVFTAIAMGNVGPLWPWPLLHELPVFGNFHVPSRFHVVVTFYLALLAGLALDRGLRWTTRVAQERRTQWAMMVLAWVLVATVGMDVLTNTSRILTRWYGPNLSGEPAENFHLVSPSPYLSLYMHYPLRNVGTASCYDPVPWDISDALWIGDVPQARVSPLEAGTVAQTHRTNHTVTAEVTLESAARVVFNQNFDRDWRLSVGEPVSDDGRLAVELPAGTHRIVADYHPRDLPWSLIPCLMGLLGGILLLWVSPARIRRWRGETAEQEQDPAPGRAAPALWRRLAAALLRTLGLWEMDGARPVGAARAALRTARRAAHQRAEAARRLASTGHLATSLELAADAFRSTLATAPPGEDALVRWALSPAERAEVRRLLKALDGRPLPDVEEDTTPAHQALCDDLITMQARLDSRLAPSTWTPGERWRHRAARFGALLALFGALAGAVAWFAWPRPKWVVSTSGTYGAQFVGVNATDGNNATEWLLPDDEPGWIEIELDPPQRVNHVRLRNAHNGSYNDRATDEYTLQVFADGRTALEEEGRWEEFDPAPVWFGHAVGIDRVQRIRVQIRSYHGNGGGLAEIEWH